MGNSLSNEYTIDINKSNGQFIDYLLDLILNQKMTLDNKPVQYNKKRLCCLYDKKSNKFAPSGDLSGYTITVPIANLDKYYEAENITDEDEIKKFLETYKVIKITVTPDKFKDICNINGATSCDYFYDNFCNTVYDENVKHFGKTINASKLRAPTVAKSDEDKNKYINANSFADCDCLNSIFVKVNENEYPLIYDIDTNKTIAPKICKEKKCYATFIEPGCSAKFKDNNLPSYFPKNRYNDIETGHVTFQNTICSIENRAEIEGLSVVGDIKRVININTSCDNKNTLNQDDEKHEEKSTKPTPTLTPTSTPTLTPTNYVPIAIGSIVFIILMIVGIYFYNKKKN